LTIDDFFMEGLDACFQISTFQFSGDDDHAKTYPVPSFQFQS
jgi:hypothetical protein